MSSFTDRFRIFVELRGHNLFIIIVTFHLHQRYSYMEKQVCKQCQKEFEADSREINRGNAQFCSLSCAASHRNLNKPLKNCKCVICNNSFKSVNTKARYCSNNCKLKAYRLRMKSNNSVNRSFKEYMINQPCEICKWNETSCDVHHILPVCEGGKDEIQNLVTLCPNCHRKVHRNLFSKDYLIEIVKLRTISSS